MASEEASARLYTALHSKAFCIHFFSAYAINFLFSFPFAYFPTKTLDKVWYAGNGCIPFPFSVFPAWLILTA